MVLLTTVFLALGTWQVQRLFWKLDLIERVEARVNAPAVPTPAEADWPSFKPDEQEYRHVTASGRLLHDKETLVQAVTERGAGFWVVTPLAEADGTTILINRGFVPSERRDPATRAEGQTPGDVTITGLLRLTEPGGAFLRSNDPAGNRWYSRDITAIAKVRGLRRVAPYFIDADGTANPGGYPVGGLTVVHFRNSHLAYIFTWYALAVMTIVVTVALRRRRLV
ncbi:MULTISPECIES: SURF1 family protein [unclassified Rhizobium]|uniref:SURF1 family protein n=1 Tax=unclassified Rhizobium TaxID=2613769 RepID=UPI0009E778CB|nr:MULTISPECIES: SURF1 family protein [unclassified Rhizobium]